MTVAKSRIILIAVLSFLGEFLLIKNVCEHIKREKLKGTVFIVFRHNQKVKAISMQHLNFHL